MPRVGVWIVLLSLSFTSFVFAQEKQQDSKARYLDTSLSIEQRVDDLVSRMTLEEKASQMQDVAPAIPRLGVPAYNWWNEGLHGVARAGYATVFPQAIGLAATFDTPLMHRVAGVISTEARAKYNDAIAHDRHDRYYGLTFWSPNINIFRDPRWGRGQETYGEDPYLTARMGVAFITGLQGDDPKYFKTIATPKHYAVHSGPEVLRHRFDVPFSKHDFEDTYSPAFRASVVEGKAFSAMCAYNSVGGVPACANPTLYDSLRKKWGFRGYVVSDCWAVTDIFGGHGYVTTQEQAAAVAVKAGTDLSCGPEYGALPAAVRNRLLSMEDMDRAVKRLFEARFRLGMFDPPESVPYSKITLADNDTNEHRELALMTALKSMVLLKNERGALPLKNVKTIAVIGPTAARKEVLLGNYNGEPSKFTTPLEGIRQRFKNTNVLYAEGSVFTETTAVPIPTSALKTAGTTPQPGLSAEYFSNVDLTGNAVTRIDPTVDFRWNNRPPAPNLPDKRYSVRWNGALTAPVTGDYRVGVTADNGVRLYLDQKMIVDDWNYSGERTLTVPIHLEAQHQYAIRLEYFHNDWENAIQLVWNPPNLLPDAVAAARKADVVIALVGLTAQLEGEESSFSSPGFFGGDRVDLELPKPQQQMLEAVAATGKPLIVVLTSGSAIGANWAQEHAAAVLEAWYPGEEGGTALAKVLAGDYNPAGRLPVTFYKAVADLPPFESYSMSGRTYRYFQGVPLYPFGYGLSYSKFAYSNLRLSSPVLDGDVTVSVDVKNAGTMTGDEVVQLYVSHPGVDAAPVRSLAAFQRVSLEPGKQTTVIFKPTDREWSIVDSKGVRKLTPGTVSIWVGGGQPISVPGLSAADGAKAELKITKEATLPE
jgi:beta-glucosidase